MMCAMRQWVCSVLGSGSLLACTLAVGSLSACGSVGRGGFEGEDSGADAAESSVSGPRFGDTEAGATTSAVQSAEVDVVLTADNAYAFGWGDQDQVAVLRGRPPTQIAADIFNCPINTTGVGARGFGPEAYTVPASEAAAGAYIYVVAWDDDARTQGALGQFKRRGGASYFSGEAGWEVCATGHFYNSSTTGTSGPAIEVVNADIAVCNAGSGNRATSSGGWVNGKGAVTPGAVGSLAIGQENRTSATFPVVCQKDAQGNQGIDANARWMWYTPDGRDAFKERGTRSYLIFRLATKDLPPPPPH